MGWCVVRNCRWCGGFGSYFALLNVGLLTILLLGLALGSAAAQGASTPTKADTITGSTKGAAVDGLPPPKPGDAPSSNGLLVSSADVILVKVLGYPSISGEYRINADDTISVPLIGRLTVANITILDLEADLAARVLKLTGKEAYATVEVVKYKPIFVSGQVASAGAYAWSPGMTVMHAETLSGGIYRPLRQGGNAALAASQTLKDRVTTDLKSALANHARLMAESSGAETVEIPERLEWLVGRGEAKQIIAQQQRLFESRAAARAAQIKTLKQTLSVTEAEYNGLQLQTDQLERQLEIRSGFHAKLMRLKADGLIPEERALEQQARIADLQERKTNLSVALSRTQGTILNLKQELIKLEEVHKAEMESEILNLERDIQKATIDLETARHAERLLGRETQDLDPAAEVQQRKTYTIMRREGSTTKQMEATKFTFVLPGDIIVVSIN